MNNYDEDCKNFLETRLKQFEFRLNHLKSCIEIFPENIRRSYLATSTGWKKPKKNMRKGAFITFTKRRLKRAMETECAIILQYLILFVFLKLASVRRGINSNNCYQLPTNQIGRIGVQVVSGEFEASRVPGVVTIALGT